MKPCMKPAEVLKETRRSTTKGKVIRASTQHFKKQSSPAKINWWILFFLSKKYSSEEQRVDAEEEKLKKRKKKKSLSASTP